MMLLRLNLLSPDKKQRLTQLIHFLFIKELFEVAILIATTAAIIHVWGWYMLTEQLSSLAASTALINRDFSHTHQTIKKNNTLIAVLQRTADGFTPLSPQLIGVATTLPPNIKLTTISFDRSEQQFTIAGLARTRAALLAYQVVLQSLPWFTHLSEPTSQLLLKENIPFQIKATVRSPLL